jgi:hypothetical protein
MLLLVMLNPAMLRVVLLSAAMLNVHIFSIFMPLPAYSNVGRQGLEPTLRVEPGKGYIYSVNH